MKKTAVGILHANWFERNVAGLAKLDKLIERMRQYHLVESDELSAILNRMRKLSNPPSVESKVEHDKWEKDVISIFRQFDDFVTRFVKRASESHDPKTLKMADEVFELFDHMSDTATLKLLLNGFVKDWK